MQETSPWGQLFQRDDIPVTPLCSFPGSPLPDRGLLQQNWSCCGPLPVWPAGGSCSSEDSIWQPSVLLAGPSAGFGVADTGVRAGRGSPAQLGVASLSHQGPHHQCGGHGRVVASQIAAMALCGFGWDRSPSPVFGVIGRGIRSVVQVTFAELSQGFRTMLSIPVNAWTLSLHLWKALKNHPVGPCRNSHSSWVTGCFQN